MLEMKDLELITGAFLISILTSTGFEFFTDMDYTSLLEFLSYGYGVNIATDIRLSKATQEYKEIKALYDEVVSRTKELVLDFGFTNPIEIFALYVYLYRSGYLSYDKLFKYGFNLKDLPGIYGADVIRGEGVCRSISSFLVSLYDKCGFDATNTSVKASSKDSKNLSKLSSAKLIHSDHSILSFVNLIGCNGPLIKHNDSKQASKSSVISSIGTIFPFANHMITSVNDSKYMYVLDPTNDGIVYCDTYKHLRIPGTDKYMKYKRFSQTVMALIGFEKLKLNPTDIKEKYREIDFEEYKKIYLDTLKIVEQNLLLLENFYDNNTSLYADIRKLTDEQRGIIGRVLPIVPKRLIKRRK